MVFFFIFSEKEKLYLNTKGAFLTFYAVATERNTCFSQNGSSVPPNFETLIGNFEVENDT